MSRGVHEIRCGMRRNSISFCPNSVLLLIVTFRYPQSRRMLPVRCRMLMYDEVERGIALCVGWLSGYRCSQSIVAQVGFITIFNYMYKVLVIHDGFIISRSLRTKFSLDFCLVLIFSRFLVFSFSRLLVFLVSLLFLSFFSYSLFVFI
jgi:hypothetical protein